MKKKYGFLLPAITGKWSIISTSEMNLLSSPIPYPLLIDASCPFCENLMASAEHAVTRCSEYEKQLKYKYEIENKERIDFEKVKRLLIFYSDTKNQLEETKTKMIKSGVKAFPNIFIYDEIDRKIKLVTQAITEIKRRVAFRSNPRGISGVLRNSYDLDLYQQRTLRESDFVNSRTHITTTNHITLAVRYKNRNGRKFRYINIPNTNMWVCVEKKALQKIAMRLSVPRIYKIKGQIITIPVRCQIIRQSLIKHIQKDYNIIEIIKIYNTKKEINNFYINMIPMFDQPWLSDTRDNDEITKKGLLNIPHLLIIANPLPTSHDYEEIKTQYPSYISNPKYRSLPSCYTIYSNKDINKIIYGKQSSLLDNRTDSFSRNPYLGWVTNSEGNYIRNYQKIGNNEDLKYHSLSIQRQNSFSLRGWGVDIYLISQNRYKVKHEIKRYLTYDKKGKIIYDKNPNFLLWEDHMSYSPQFVYHPSFYIFLTSFKKIYRSLSRIRIFGIQIQQMFLFKLNKVVQSFNRRENQYIQFEEKKRSKYLMKCKWLLDYTYDFCSIINSTLTKIILNNTSNRTIMDFIIYINTIINKLWWFIIEVEKIRCPIYRFNTIEEIRYYKKVIKEISMQISHIKKKKDIPNDYEQNESKFHNSFVNGKKWRDDFLDTPISLFHRAEIPMNINRDYIVSQYSIGLYDKYAFNGKLRTSFRGLFNSVFSNKLYHNNTTLMRSTVKDIMSKVQFEMKNKGYIELYSLENMMFYRTDPSSIENLTHEVEEFIKENPKTEEQIAAIRQTNFKFGIGKSFEQSGFPSNIFSVFNADGVAGDIRIKSVDYKKGQSVEKYHKISKTMYFSTLKEKQYLNLIGGIYNEPIQPDTPAKMFEKREQVKIRPVISTGMNVYIHLKRIVSIIELMGKTAQYYPVYSLQSNKDEVLNMNFINYCITYNLKEKRYILIPLDYSKFDHTISSGAILEMLKFFISKHSGYILYKSDLAWFENHLKDLKVTISDSKIELKYNDGMLSGWAITNILESFMNQAFSRTVFRRLGLENAIVKLQTNGDDVYIILDSNLVDDKSKISSLSLLLTNISREYERLGLSVHPTKNMISYNFCEFLRVAYYGIWTVKYPFRGLCSFFAHKPTSILEGFDVTNLEQNMQMLTSRLGIRSLKNEIWEDYKNYFQWEKFKRDYSKYIKDQFSYEYVPIKNKLLRTIKVDKEENFYYNILKYLFPYAPEKEIERQWEKNFKITQSIVRLRKIPLEKQYVKQISRDLFQSLFLNATHPSVEVYIRKDLLNYRRYKNLTTGSYNLDGTILEYINSNKILKYTLDKASVDQLVYGGQLDIIGGYDSNIDLQNKRNKTDAVKNAVINIFSKLNERFKIKYGYGDIFSENLNLAFDYMKYKIIRNYEKEIAELNNPIYNMVTKRGWEYIFNKKEFIDFPSSMIENKTFIIGVKDLISSIFRPMLLTDPNLLSLSKYEQKYYGMVIYGIASYLNSFEKLPATIEYGNNLNLVVGYCQSDMSTYSME